MFQLRAIAQSLNTYIVAEHESGIFIIEQHVAHERVIFERLRKAWSSSFVPCAAGVELPQRLAEDDERLLVLTSLGFEINLSHADGRRKAFLHSLPEVLRDAPKHEDVCELLWDLSLSNGSTEGLVDDAAAKVACKAAVRNGQALTPARMNSIVHDLMACENAHTCPHGRPIFLELSQVDLASIFKRGWTPNGVASRNMGFPSPGSGFLSERLGDGVVLDMSAISPDADKQSDAG
jgi:DNA mismatch repair protein MutL